MAKPCHEGLPRVWKGADAMEQVDSVAAVRGVDRFEARRAARAHAKDLARMEALRKAEEDGFCWFVIQVSAGAEGEACRLILQACNRELVRECFCPMFATQQKVKGAWCDVVKPLLPGYVIAVARDAAVLKAKLGGVSRFTRILKMGEGFVPLTSEERGWFCQLTVPGDRTVPMSTGVMKGDCVRVVSGPLVGHEAWITGINRHKSLAFIKIDMFGREIQTRIGLGIVKRVENKPRRGKERLA